MAKDVYIGINDTARKVKKMYIGVNGVARKVKKAYIGINGVARLFYDTDAGGGWTNGTLPSSANWTSVAFGNGRFVAIASGSNKAAYSFNGINWTSATLPSSASWASVTYGGGKFVAVASGGTKAAYSTDGINWTAATLPVSAAWNCVGYNSEKGYFSTLHSSTNTSYGGYSIDGITWKPSIISYPFSAIAYGNSKLIAVSTNTGSNTFAIANNTGSNWANAVFISPTPTKLSSWYGVTYGLDKFVAIASGAKAAYSATGAASSWTEIALPLSASWRSVAYGNGIFVAVANASGQYIFSENGILWTAGEMPLSANWRNVAFGNGRFVSVAYGSDKVACLLG